MSKKITLFLIDGLPQGLRSVRIDQWVGKAVCAPRGNFKKIDYSEMVGSSCIYFLVGINEENDLPNIYVGESDTFGNRLSDHNYKKDWWRELVVFYSLDKSLTKTSARYLEKICIDRLAKAGRCNLMNGNERNEANIPLEDKSGLEEFYSNITTILPLLGYDVFEQIDLGIGKRKGLQLLCTSGYANARGIFLTDGKMIVLKGSTINKENTPSFDHHNYNNLKDKLIEIGKLSEQDDSYIFTDDYEFSSPSAAAAVILGRSASGPNEWRDKNGKKLKVLIDE